MKTITKFIFGLPMLALLFASFAVVQSVQAEPNEADPIGNVAEEDNAVLELGSNTEQAAVGQAQPNPNQRVLQVKNFEKSFQCAGGKVKLSFKVAVTFKHVNGLVVRDTIKFLGFEGTAVGGRKLEPVTSPEFKSLRFLHTLPSPTLNEAKKEGVFAFEFWVRGPGLPASSQPFQIVVRYQPNFYKWRDGKVTGEVIWDKTPVMHCSNVP